MRAPRTLCGGLAGLWCLALAGLVLGAAGPASAEELPTGLQVELQSAMLTYTDSLLVDGGYGYVDTRTGEARVVYPANVHPFVVVFGDDYFVCSEMVDDDGGRVTADYLVRRVGDDWRVVQLILDDRAAIERALARLGE